MTDTPLPNRIKERSKSFPVIALKAAIERLEQFEKKFGRHPAPYEKTGLAWGMEEGSSQANRILAALKSFGLLDYSGSGKDRTVSLSDAGRTYLRAQQESIKKEILKVAALKPKQISKFWPLWGTDRPPTELCIDQLVLKEGFTDSAAPQFLKVYDETIAYAGLSSSDKSSAVASNDSDDEEDEPLEAVAPAKAEERRTPPPEISASQRLDTPLAQGERVLTTGMLAKGATFKLIVSGHVGPRELDRLIRKLELDKEILADPFEDDDQAAN
jgi:hypothetical protein